MESTSAQFSPLFCILLLLLLSILPSAASVICVLRNPPHEEEEEEEEEAAPEMELERWHQGIAPQKTQELHPLTRRRGKK